MDSIAYRTGYRYQLVEDYDCATGIEISKPIESNFSIMYRGGALYIKAGYAWDGPSGPAIHTKNFMRGSLVHDALYQLMRERQLDHDIYRDTVDRLLQAMCLEDGMSTIRAWWVYHGVHFGGGPAADPANEKPIIKAP